MSIEKAQAARWPKRTPEERFWSKVDRRGPDECWPWTSPAKTREHLGYGQLRTKERAFHGEVLSNRIAWIIAHGQIPTGLLVLHTCHFSLCCNARHMYLGTQRENGRDKAVAGRGRSARGMDQWHAKLTDADVRAIRAKHASEVRTCAQTAREYGVDHSTITGIVKERTWRHLLTR